jgi:pimeloyl-ACP methyl ester carboxylesterase
VGTWHDQLEQLSDEVTLTGLPSMEPWSALLEIGSERISVAFRDGDLTVGSAGGINASWDFSFSLTEQEWQEFLGLPPRRGFTSAQAIVATQGSHRVRGDRAAWARAAVLVDRIFEALRRRGQAGRTELASGPAPAPAPLGLSPIEGRYVTLDVDGTRHRIYFESAGKGIPVVCLHTAGADSRQFRYLLEDGELTQKYQVHAFDMPWHGRSDPPDDWPTKPYRLTTERYAATVLSFVNAIGLATPILVGCSMGGAIALYLASQYGDRFRGVCALEGGLGNPGRFVDWTNRADVDHSGFLTSWVGGLMAPTSPEGPRNQTLWGYAQSGPGIYQGDTYFYSQDFPRYSADLPVAGCPLYVFSGEYDYSATSEMSREAARRLGGELIYMPGKGHFPMSEDPVGFAEYLYPVLDKLRNGE